jgi:hypothetical protein
VAQPVGEAKDRLELGEISWTGEFLNGLDLVRGDSNALVGDDVTAECSLRGTEVAFGELAIKLIGFETLEDFL